MFVFPHYNVEEHPSKKSEKSFNSQNGKPNTKSPLVILKTEPQLGCVAQDSEPSRHQTKTWSSGETQGKLFWDQFDQYDSLSPRSVKHLSVKRKLL